MSLKIVHNIKYLMVQMSR